MTSIHGIGLRERSFAIIPREATRERGRGSFRRENPRPRLRGSAGSAGPWAIRAVAAQAEPASSTLSLFGSAVSVTVVVFFVPALALPVKTSGAAIATEL